MRLTHTLALVGLLCGVLFAEPVAARVTSQKFPDVKRLEAGKRWELSARGPNARGEARRATNTAAPPRVKNITFSNPKASRAYARLGELASLCLTRSQNSSWMVRPFLKSALTSVHLGLASSLSAQQQMSQERCGFSRKFCQATFP